MLMMRRVTVAYVLTLLIGVVAYFTYGSVSEMKDNREAGRDQFHLETLSDVAGVRPNEPFELVFAIKDHTGSVLKDYTISHEKLMHLIAVRKDLQGFQHLHPEFDSRTGRFSTAVTFASDGTYALFPDFVTTDPGGKPLPVTLYKEFTVGNISNYAPQPIGDSSEDKKTVDGYDIKFSVSPRQPLSNQTVLMTFSIGKDGMPVMDLEKYLGALGHAVVLSEGKLDFIHSHPLDENFENPTGEVRFNVVFPTQGNYKVFMQFQHEGKVRTAEFIVPVLQGRREIADTSSDQHAGH